MPLEKESKTFFELKKEVVRKRNFGQNFPKIRAQLEAKGYTKQELDEVIAAVYDDEQAKANKPYKKYKSVFWVNLIIGIVALIIYFIDFIYG